MLYDTPIYRLAWQFKQSMYAFGDMLQSWSEIIKGPDKKTQTDADLARMGIVVRTGR